MTAHEAFARALEERIWETRQQEKDQRGAAVVVPGSTGAYTGAETRPEGTGCAGVESREPVPVAQSAPHHSPAERHQWDADGERCVKCGEKDWMAGPVCHGRIESPADQVPQQKVSGEIGKIEAMPEASARASCSEPARSGGPTLTPALSAWLEEIREYLSSRQDVRDGSDGPRPNEEMTLLANLDEALRRPTFPNGNTAGPSAVEEAMVEVIAEQHKVIDRLRADNLERGKQKLALMQEIDRLRAESDRLEKLLAANEGRIEKIVSDELLQRAERAERDVIVLCLRLCMEPNESHSPYTADVLNRWRNVWEAVAGGMTVDAAIAKEESSEKIRAATRKEPEHG